MRFETEEGEEGDRQVLSKDSILQTINDKIYGQKKIKKKKKKNGQDQKTLISAFA